MSTQIKITLKLINDLKQINLFKVFIAFEGIIDLNLGVFALIQCLPSFFK
jgi:hypothetical protein